MRVVVRRTVRPLLLLRTLRQPTIRLWRSFVTGGSSGCRALRLGAAGCKKELEGVAEGLGQWCWAADAVGEEMVHRGLQVHAGDR